MKRRFLLLLGLLPLAARAELGGVVDSIARDRVQLHSAAYKATPVRSYTVHSLQLQTGTSVNEYVNGVGIVFAVSWVGPFPPDLHQLLGDTFYPSYNSAAHAGFGHHPVRIHNQSLMLETAGHGRQFSGHAWVPDLLPSGVNGAELP